MLDPKDKRPVYITPDGYIHRQLSSTYQDGNLTKDLLILTYEEYQLIKGTEELTNKIKALTDGSAP